MLFVHILCSKFHISLTLMLMFLISSLLYQAVANIYADLRHARRNHSGKSILEYNLIGGSPPVSGFVKELTDKGTVSRLTTVSISRNTDYQADPSLPYSSPICKDYWLISCSDGDDWTTTKVASSILCLLVPPYVAPDNFGIYVLKFGLIFSVMGLDCVDWCC